MKKVSIIGAGAWGSALAFVSLRSSLKTTIWSKNSNIVKEINESGKNTKYTGQAILLPGLKATTSLKEGLEDADIVINALPANAIKDIFTSAKPFFKKNTILINASKGIDSQTHKMPYEIFNEIFSKDIQYLTTSGPGFANGLLKNDPTTMNLASENKSIAQKIKEIVKEKQLYFIVSDDIIGVEWGGLYKNIIAIAAGLSVGLKYGENTSALVFLAGIKEMVSSGIKMGAKAETFYQPAGIGDVMLSTSSMKSRNFSFGFYLTEGKNIKNIFSQLSGIAEGYYTLQSLSYLKKKYNLDLPLATMLEDIIFKKIDSKKAFLGFLEVHSE